MGRKEILEVLSLCMAIFLVFQTLFSVKPIKEEPCIETDVEDNLNNRNKRMEYISNIYENSNINLDKIESHPRSDKYTAYYIFNGNKDEFLKMAQQLKDINKNISVKNVEKQYNADNIQVSFSIEFD